MIGIIVALNDDCVIGKDGTIPWRYPGDLRRFARVTAGSTVIMGRKTWESIPAKFRPLKGRANIVVTSSLALALSERGIFAANSVDAALALTRGEYGSGLVAESNVWFIGGASIYAAAFPYADVIDITYVPDDVDPDGAALFPIDLLLEEEWDEGPLLQHEDEPPLKRRIYTRRKPT